jgi:uncharacterized protein (DUF1684 family)
MGQGSLSLLDWRRQVTALYAEVRAEPDPAAGHRRWREGRDRLFRESPDSPLAAGDPRRDAGLPVAPYDPRLRFVAPVEPAEPELLSVPTGTDGIVGYERIGRVRLAGLGPLDVWWLTSYGGGLFVPVRDGNPRAYGGGRYLLDTVKGADLGSEAGGLVVDLNFLYHPSCAYDPAWTCPLAPPGNMLDAVVEAGELLP